MVGWRRLMIAGLTLAVIQLLLRHREAWVWQSSDSTKISDRRRGGSKLEVETSLGAGSSSGPLPPPPNWAFYLDFHEDLRAQGITTEAQARQHYLERGRYEGRLAQPVRLVLRYVACGGLCNQLYSFIPALLIAKGLGAEVVLYPFRSRSSFDSADINIYAPVGLLLDVERLASYWAQRGLIVHETPPLAPQFHSPYALYDVSAAGQRCLTAVVREDPNNKRQTLSALVGQLKREAAVAAQTALKGDPAARFDCIYIDTQCTFFATNVSSIRGKVEEVARGLFFNNTLVAAAEEALLRLGKHQGAGPFNGLHLRLEADSGWVQIMGGMQSALSHYREAMTKAGFSQAADLYVASGLAPREREGIAAGLQEAGLCRRVIGKEELFPQALLDGLLPEQAGLLDLLILSKAQQVVGSAASSFSFFLQEYRALQGVPRKTMHWVRHPGLDLLHEFEALAALS